MWLCLFVWVLGILFLSLSQRKTIKWKTFAERKMLFVCIILWPIIIFIFPFIYKCFSVFDIPEEVD